MRHVPRLLFVAGAASCLILASVGCATLSEVAALRLVTFDFDHVSDVRLAGIPIGGSASYTSLAAIDLGKLVAAVGGGHAPLELVAHVNATNPPSNSVAARLVNLTWKLSIDERETVSGVLGRTFVIPPGGTADVPVKIELDLVRFFEGGARDLFELAVEIAGGGRTTKALRLDLVPTIETSIGPIRYPAPIVIRRPAS